MVIPIFRIGNVRRIRPRNNGQNGVSSPTNFCIDERQISCAFHTRYIFNQLERKFKGKYEGISKAYRSSRSFAQVAAIVCIEFGEAEVVEHDEVELGERGEQFGIGAVDAGDGDVVQQPRQSQVQRGESIAAGLMGERAGEPEPGLADAAQASDILMRITLN